MKKITYVSLLTLAFLACGTFVSCSKDNEDEKGGHGKISVTIDESGIATQGHTFVAIDARNFYLDYIKYTVEDGHLVVTGCDDAGINGIAKIVSDVTLRGNHYEVLGIVERAFEKCKGFDTVIIPDGVRSIGGYAFWECVYLTSLTIPGSVTSIGKSAFGGCSGLTSVTIPGSVTSIGDGAFSGCSGLTSLTIPNGITSIGDYAFSRCSGLTSLTIPSSVTSIGKSAFSGCSGLTSLTIPSSVTSIGDNAFLGCSGLTSINVESGNPKYDSRDNCNAIIETATNTLINGCSKTIIPSSVTSIGESAFEYCSGLTSVTIPNSVTSISNGAFSGCI